MPVYEYYCKCGFETEEFRKIDERYKVPICENCFEKMKLGISKTRVMNAESFNPHYDVTQGEYFGSAEEKKDYLRKTGKLQSSGQFSPRRSTKMQVICNREQSKHLDSPTKESEKRRKEL